NFGARSGKTLSRCGHGNHHVLRRRLPLGDGVRRGAKNGLQKSPLAHRRPQRHARRRLADDEMNWIIGLMDEWIDGLGSAHTYAFIHQSVNSVTSSAFAESAQ